MNILEISSNLTTEEIKEKIRAIGYYRYPLNREKGFGLMIKWFYLLFILGFIMWGADTFNIKILFIGTILLMITVIFAILFLGLWLLATNNDPDKDKKWYEEILWFLEAVIYNKNIIDIKYQKLQLLVSIDTIENDIDPSLVIQIKNTIQEISDIIQSIHWMEWNILENKKYSHIFNNEEEYLYYLDLFISKYKKELFALFDYFEKSIQEWLTLHTQELETIELNIYHQSKELWSENLAIQDIRLRWYLENLKNTVNLNIPS